MHSIKNPEWRPLLFGLFCTLLILALGRGLRAQAASPLYQTVPTPTPPTIPTPPSGVTPRPPDEVPPTGRALVLTMKVEPQDILPEEEIEFSLQITNATASAVTGIVLTDRLDPALHLLEVGATQGAAELKDATLTVHLGTLEAGQAALLVFRARVGAETGPGQIILNQVTAFFDGGQGVSNVVAAGLPPDRLPATGLERRAP
jgi:uncharacterized repeat protein (TIGR01451 family)